ncbi:DUF2254 domain-containing protein [Bacillaceae bacterium S4-13-58]
MKRLRSTLMYIPTIYGIFAVIFAFFSIFIDRLITEDHSSKRFLPDLLFSDLYLAQTILSAIASSLLTMTTITFSTILVVLTTFLSQFSPRTLRNFITDRVTQRVLGFFVGGFIYSIILLLSLKDRGTEQVFVFPSFSVFISIACVLVFVFFIHHVTSWIQVSSLIHNITIHTISKIDEELTDKDQVTEDAPWEDWESEDLLILEAQPFYLNKTGYIQEIDVDGILEQATKLNCIVRLEKKLGDYVDQDTPVLSIWKLDESEEQKNFERFFSVTIQMSPAEDIEFGIVKIVEIGLRALSPGINDPNTAINSIDNLGKILTKLGKKHLPRPYMNDEDRNLRVIKPQLTFSDYLYRSFYQIRQSGFHDISVLSNGLEALTLIADSNDSEIKKDVWELALYIKEGIDSDALLSLDRKFVHEKFSQLAKACGHYQEYEKEPL